jgi:hypothetical protein
MNQINTVSEESLLRRFNLVLDIQVKPEYCIPNTRMLNKYHKDLVGGINPDIWDIKIKIPRSVEKKGSFKTVIYEEVKDWKSENESDTTCAIRYVREHLTRDWEMSKFQHKNRNREDRFCDECGVEQVFCICCKPPVLKPEGFQDTLYTSYEWFHRGVEQTGVSLQSQLMYVDKQALFFGDAILGQYARLMMRKFILQMKFNILKHCWTKLSMFSIFFMLYISLCTFDVRYLYCSVGVVSSLATYYCVDNVRKYGQLLVYLFVLILSLYSPFGGSLCFCIISFVVYYLQIQENEYIRLTQQYERNCSLLRSQHVARYTLLSVLSLSTLGIFFLAVLKITQRVFFAKP